MKILMAASCSSNPNLGVPGVMHSLAHEYRAAGHEVRFRFRDQPGRIGEILFGWNLARCPDARWADVVDSHAVEAWPLCGMKKRPAVVARSHGLEIVVHRRLMDAVKSGQTRTSLVYKTYRGTFRLWAERQAIRNADASFILNAGDLAICKQEFQASDDRLHLLPNGYPAAFLDKPLEFAPNDGVAFVGSWLSRKGTDLAVKALTALLRKHPAAKVLLAGTGVDTQATLADFPEDIRPALTLRPKFQRHELPELLAGYGILLFPSRSEGYPLSLVEAMACGLAPVAAAIPGVVDVIQNDRNGILVPTEDADSLTRELLALFDSPSNRERLRIESRESVRPTSWNLLASRQLAIYEKIIANRVPHSALGPPIPNSKS